MITVRKLRTLKKDTRFRKYIVILQDTENSVIKGKSLNLLYIKEVLTEMISEEEFQNIKDRTAQLIHSLNNREFPLRQLNGLRHELMKFMGMEPSEWDFITPGDGKKETGKKFPISIYMDDIRSPFNVGSIFRTAECFGVNKIYLSEDTCPPDHRRAERTSMGCTSLVSWEKKPLGEIPGPFFTLELGGTSVNEFSFPSEGTVILGSEELGVSPEALKVGDSSLGRVSIPMSGTKGSLNVSNAAAILLHMWHSSLTGK